MVVTVFLVFVAVIFTLGVVSAHAAQVERIRKSKRTKEEA